MSRKPVYHDNDNQYRIISLPNGLWQAQRYSGQKGTRETDPWLPISRPCERAVALTYLPAKA